jgi:amylosucrase
MPLLATTEGKSDGGYAVSDYRKVQEKLGTMEDFRSLTESCHKQQICVCLDYVMNHTSEDHEWALRARSGEKEYQDRYFFFDTDEIPNVYEQTVPQVFPKTAPGNFTYLEDIHKYVMTTFYPYQWDLNYRNPVVFNEMVYNLLFLANQGIDVVRIDAVPYIWKKLGTNCRNLPQVHSMVRMMRIISEIVCPGILLLGEVVMEPKELAPYFGTVEKPECHLLYNVTTMATLWHTVATRDVRLLKSQMDQVNALPKEYSFLNYLRCHDDIGWGLDYGRLREWGMEEVPHKQFLNDYFLGNFPGSTSSGELYNYDPTTGDARFCGTTASMCGIEKGNLDGVELDLMLHAFLLFQSGIPVIYSGDEVAACNDWSYLTDVHKAEDSRYIHRGAFDWSKVEEIEKNQTVVSKIFHGLTELETARESDSIFDSDANVYTIETHNASVLGMVRIRGDEWMIGLFNFSDQDQRVWIVEMQEHYRNVFTGKKTSQETFTMLPHEFLWLKKCETLA